ncbi:MAG: hypothetical protein V4532_16725 [Pseudomonadota bacterium]
MSQRRLEVYAKMLNQGLFRPVTWASAICTETGGLYRVNGKHTSILLAGLERMPEFFVTIEEYECDTLEDVARLYATFDSRMQTRSANDIYLSFASTIPELACLPHKAIFLAAAGIYYALNPTVGHGASQPAERAELLLEYPEFVIWLAEIMTGGHRDNQVGKANSAHLRRVGVTAAMFSTWHKAKADATAFWTMVRDETGATPSTPDRKLAKFLITTGANSEGKGSKVKHADIREFYVRSLHAWSAWRKNEPTDLRYYPDKKIPAVA